MTINRCLRQRGAFKFLLAVIFWSCLPFCTCKFSPPRTDERLPNGWALAECADKEHFRLVLDDDDDDYDNDNDNGEVSCVHGGAIVQIVAHRKWINILRGCIRKIWLHLKLLSMQFSVKFHQLFVKIVLSGTRSRRRARSSFPCIGNGMFVCALGHRRVDCVASVADNSVYTNWKLMYRLFILLLHYLLCSD